MAAQFSPSDASERAKFAAELLPPGAQREWLQATVERILAQPLRTRAELITYHTKRAELCRQFAEQLPTMDRILGREGLLAHIAEQEQHERQLLDVYERMPTNYRESVFTRQVELLLAWGTAGGDLEYERGRKKVDDLRFPPPKGQVVSFLERTADVQAGTTHNIVTRYRQLQLHPIAFTQFAGAGSLTIHEDEEHFYFIDKHERKVYRDGRKEPDPDQEPEKEQ